MNLVIDIGNTTAKIAVFDREEPVEVIHTSNQTLSSLQEIVDKYPVRKGIVSSVITLTDDVKAALAYTGIRMLHFTSETPIPITNLYETPKTLGSDRLAAVVAANYLHPGHDALVIDAGTCITYDFIDAAGNYRGGNISPGIDMRLKSLHTFTDKLPLISPEGEYRSWGSTTEGAIRSGVIRGIGMEISGYILETSREYPDLYVFLTGGNGFSFDIKIKNAIFADKYLVLKGLNRILNYNETIS